jgi:hypothetical protein
LSTPFEKNLVKDLIIKEHQMGFALMSLDRCPHLVDCNVLEEGNHNLYRYNFHGTTSTKFGKIGCGPKEEGKKGGILFCA